VTPKGETQLTPEEKLLRAIFGEKAGDVKTPRCIARRHRRNRRRLQYLLRKGQEKAERAKAIEEEQISRCSAICRMKFVSSPTSAPSASACCWKARKYSALHDEKTNKRLVAKGTNLTAT